jgi:hypothetical protein
MNRIRIALAALAAALLVPACGPQSSGGPTAEEKQLTQTAEAGMGAGAGTVKAATNAVLDSGSNNAATASISSKSTGSAVRATVTSFNFAAAVDVTIDLDAQDGGGNDLYPHASGRLHVVAAGQVTGTNTAGNAVYAVQTEWVTDGVFTDPQSGCTATLAAGSGIDWVLTVSWNWIAENNWTLSGTNDFSGQHTVTVVDDGQTWTATWAGERHAGAVLTMTPAGLALGTAVSGHVEVTISGPGGTHTVVFDWMGAGAVKITCDGQVYGPYVVGVAKIVFGCDLE